MLQEIWGFPSQGAKVSSFSYRVGLEYKKAVAQRGWENKIHKTVNIKQALQ